MLQGCLHRTLSAQTLQPFSPPAAHHVEPSRGKARVSVFSLTFFVKGGLNSEIHFFPLFRVSVQTSSTCSGLSRCCFTALRSTALYREEMEISACCLL